MRGSSCGGRSKLCVVLGVQKVTGLVSKERVGLRWENILSLFRLGFVEDRRMRISCIKEFLGKFENIPIGVGKGTIRVSFLVVPRTTISTLLMAGK